jgi:hypothetical protein
MAESAGGTMAMVRKQAQRKPYLTNYALCHVTGVEVLEERYRDLPYGSWLLKDL